MAETLIIPQNSTKTEKYNAIIPQIKAITDAETDLIANLANVVAILKETFNFFWVGFYMVKENQLVLAPFQGTLACTRIPFHKGVCGACYRSRATLIVPNVDEFADHIACSSASKSEIVVPVLSKNEVVAVLDVDSDVLDDFDEADKEGLEKIIEIVGKLF